MVRQKVTLPAACTAPQGSPTPANMLVLGGEILLLTRWSQDSLVHLYRGQHLSQLDSPITNCPGTRDSREKLQQVTGTLYRHGGS